jgi:hypothetical protein
MAKQQHEQCNGQTLCQRDAEQLDGTMFDGAGEHTEAYVDAWGRHGGSEG